MRAQRALAILLTVLFFGLVVFGLGALFAVFHERTWGYVIGGFACVVMVYAGINSLRGSDGPSPRPGTGKAADGSGGGKPAGKGGTGGKTAGGRGKNSAGAGSDRSGRTGRR
ncbi:hypothetical protein I6A60_14745 [Frankia sp. AgB1.9]|uniref:hypothetical protein n=1 Tax=unclassified Frankia TaxID=2632575 RepID=UPI001932F55F|nr:MULTISPECIES: hypothetical protein [unclassified Frankia]MBL7488614.1 hypothetical protein [Frankia sp. AgW1.1]MBL7549132.1 hypothetical protein [Frankia sp. AgB1.9]MBL7619184.1 hypothetical protein [Frankia sp. AgB1.8]